MIGGVPLEYYFRNVNLAVGKNWSEPLSRGESKKQAVKRQRRGSWEEPQGRR